MNNSEKKFWMLVKKIHEVKFDKDKIRYSKKSNREEKLKILTAIDIAVHNRELLEASAILYRKHSLIRMVLKHLFKFYMKSFDHTVSEQDLNDDIMEL